MRDGTPVFVTDHGGGGWDLSRYTDTDSWFAGHLHVSEFSRRQAGHERTASAEVIYGGVDCARFVPASVS